MPVVNVQLLMDLDMIQREIFYIIVTLLTSIRCAPRVVTILPDSGDRYMTEEH
jgi:hypothetical protein